MTRRLAMIRHLRFVTTTAFSRGNNANKTTHRSTIRSPKARQTHPQEPPGFAVPFGVQTLIARGGCPHISASKRSDMAAVL